MTKREFEKEKNKFYAWREKVVTGVRKKGYAGELYPQTLNFLYLDKTSVRESVKILVQTAQTFKRN